MDIIKTTSHTRGDIATADNTDILYVLPDTPDAVIDKALKTDNPQRYINLNGWSPKYQPSKQEAIQRKQENIDISTDAIISEMDRGVSSTTTFRNVLDQSNTNQA